MLGGQLTVDVADRFKVGLDAGVLEDRLSYGARVALTLASLAGRDGDSPGGPDDEGDGDNGDSAGGEAVDLQPGENCPERDHSHPPALSAF